MLQIRLYHPVFNCADDTLHILLISMRTEIYDHRMTLSVISHRSQFHQSIVSIIHGFLLNTQVPDPNYRIIHFHFCQRQRFDQSINL